ncbi:hypothetical protein Kpol_1013p58 [Vanderwaltozyma polyspora DSM 70294]|uniref:Pyrroline-5-carboxylate reductase n=1 Tax=Vanderwaltozyma polyspora (strain ATCC 22028 / DSM 70294 / BCRC 21397 / CBS 2163 / NBRC 10782 / NRRL Y-8283 / UCD 57-17) TaxID=436907 RepID=A7THA5_VANPO|nr:uncharacterized protein Kpol_1013p58 [Vanderwaltozyma polyspora DSM 70294]EDO18386.1 hypothetical protein Kpol_1013p58 [Vanderwaltozyma polyspora DSM 70294]
MGYTLAMIGCGVMGQAVLSAIYNAPKAESLEEKTRFPAKIIASNYDEESAKLVTDLINGFSESPNGIVVESTWGKNEEVVEEAQVIFLGVKPFVVNEVMEPLIEKVSGKLLISICAGWTIESLSKYSNQVSRIMTNTPAKYGYGCAVVSHSPQVSISQKQIVKQLISQVGKYVELPEKNMDAATALVGSGPAFVLLMLESLMESGIKMGIPLKESKECAMKVMEGTIKMVEESGQHPSVLKHQVCTPGGTTIAGLCVMEDKGVKSGIIRGVEEASIVSAKLGKK